MVALRETIQRFHIPPRPFLDLLFAFEQDQLVKRYATYEQLLGYCRYSANPVGRLVLYLCEAFDVRRAALSDHVCTALQLANFWQDVARDFDIGRVYLPEEDRRRFGYGDADLESRRFTPAFAELMRFEVDRTRDLFYRGLPLAGRGAARRPARHRVVPARRAGRSCARSSAAVTMCGGRGRPWPGGKRRRSWPAPCAPLNTAIF